MPPSTGTDRQLRSDPARTARRSATSVEPSCGARRLLDDERGLAAALRYGRRSSCLAPEQSELDDGHRGDDHEHGVRDRTGVPEMKEIKALLVHVDRHR